MSQAMFQPRAYVGKNRELTTNELGELAQKYDLDPGLISKAGWTKGTSLKGFELVLPVYSPQAALRGHLCQVRTPSGKKEVEAFKILDEPWMCWYRTSNPEVIVVEDHISALKACPFATTVCLIGTSLTPEKMQEISLVAKGNRIWLALDKDASLKSIGYLKQYRGVTGGKMAALMLGKDIKDVPRNELKKLGGPFELS